MPTDRLVRIQCNPGPYPGQYLETRRYYTGDDVVPFRDETADVFSCSAFNLPAGTELRRACLNPIGDPGATAGILYVIYYDGDGGLAAGEFLRNSPECPLGCSLGVAPPRAERRYANGPVTAGWTIRVTAFSTNYPITATLSGQEPQIFIDPQAVAEAVFEVPPSGTFTVRFEDGAGCNENAETLVLRDSSGEIDATLFDLDLLSFVYAGFDDNGIDEPRPIFERVGHGYHLATHTAVAYRYQVNGPEGQGYSRDVREVIDSYLLDDGRTLRQVRHDGSGGARFTDTVPETEQQTGGELVLLNLIKTDIDEAGTDSGRVWLEAESPALPITYRVDIYQNQTGQFANLAPGRTSYSLTDKAGRTLSGHFIIEDRYRPRWIMRLADLAGLPVELDILERDWQGAADTVCGAGYSPLVRAWQGAGSDPQAQWPEAYGQTLTLTLLSERPRQFLQMSKQDDRQHRVDLRHGGRLVFRGYIAPDTYREVLLGGPQAITVTASCGLGPLSELEFRNHLGEPMRGRRPLLSTILHLLSLTDTNLPLYVGHSLRELGMPAETEPLLQAWADRTAYAGGKQSADVPLCRPVLDALNRTFFLQIGQREGAWWLEAVPELDDTTLERRTYLAEGLEAAPVPAPAPFHVTAPGEIVGPHYLHWQTNAQALEVVPAAAAVRATVALQLRETLLDNSNFQKWDALATRPLGWSFASGREPGPAVQRVRADKVGRYELQLRPFAGGGGLLSSAVQVLSGQDESLMRLSIKARTLGIAGPVGGPKPQARIVRLPVGVSVNGVPFPQTLDFEFDSSEKSSEQEVILPAGLGPGLLRVLLQSPELLSGPVDELAAPVRVIIESVKLAIVPGARVWPDEDQITALNEQRGYVLLSPVELTHADLPRQALVNGVPAPLSQMDVQAWRHALSTPAGRATVAWQRTGQDETAVALPLLELAAAERLGLRTDPLYTLLGVVRGPLSHLLGPGRVLDAVYDEPGRYAVVACQIDELSGQATIAARRLRSGSFATGGAAGLTGRVRWTELGPRYTAGGYRQAGT